MILPTVLLCLAFFTVPLSAQYDISTMLNTKSPYPYRTVTPLNMNGCEDGTILHYNLVARHGTRIPTGGDINSFSKLQTTLATYGQYILNPHYSWMQSWVSPFQSQLSGQLDQAGELEHYNISKRVLKTFMDQFSSPYHPTTYPIQATAVTRTSRSGSAFTFGLFEGEGVVGPTKFQPVAIVTDSPSQDITLRFFDNCPAYQNLISNNSVNVDSQLYLAKYSATILQKVKARLQIQSGWNITFSDVQTFYKLCSFDVSLHHITNKFCSLFDLDDIYRFETSNDLSDYWIKGYGYPINYEISCPLLKDFFTSFNNVIKPGGAEKAKLRFAHAETILPFASLLGLFSDDFVLHYDSPRLNERNWRSSLISPFAANIAMVLYNCTGTYKVKLLFNEVEVPIPGCGEELFCPLSTLQSMWSKALNCNFNSLCGIN